MIYNIHKKDGTLSTVELDKEPNSTLLIELLLDSNDNLCVCTFNSSMGVCKSPIDLPQTVQVLHVV